MHFQKSYKIGPRNTPIIIKIILGFIISLSLFNALITPFFKAHYITYFLGLSVDGLKNYYFWQLVTYNFLQISYGISISFIIELLFNVYLIWIIATSVLERISQIQYVIFYILNSVFSAFVMLAVMAIGYPHFIYAGATISLYATLVAWMMLNPPDTRIFLFFAIPMKHYWLVLGLIGFNLLSNLSNNQMVNFFGCIAVSVFSYFYSVIIWAKHSPFQSLNNMERSLIHIFKPIIDRLTRKKFH
jgi:membrane associated rhomboid family serine protease